jgi:hypothetical protein
MQAALEKARPRLMPVSKQPQSPETKQGVLDPGYEHSEVEAQLERIDTEILQFETLLKQAKYA